MEIKWIAIAMAIMMCFAFIGIGIDKYSKNVTEVEFAKLGYVQCIDFGKILWKKECNK